MEDWITIRTLHNQGKSQRQIAKDLKISRNTVKKYLENDDKPTYRLTKKRTTQLDDFKSDIKEMYFSKKFVGSRILEEIRKKGYNASPSTFYEYFKKIKNSERHNKISIPYNTPAAKQCQFDWAVYNVKINNKIRKIYIFSVILSYSRKRKYVVSLSDDMESVFCAISEAFEYFDGVPKEILVDNARQMVNNPNRLKFEWNRNFETFCGLYGITPRACKVRTPKTKGKVEKPFNYLEQHFIKGNDFANFNDLEIKLRNFNEKVNNKIHSNTRRTPNEMFDLEERHLLNKLPKSNFIGILEELRKVNMDLLISYESNKYSVPKVYAGKTVFVKKVKGIILEIYSQKCELIATHSIPDGKYNIVKNNEHYSGIAKDTPKTLSLLKEEFNKYFEGNKAFLDKLFETKKYSSYRDLRIIISIRKYYSDEAIKKAMQECIEYNRVSSKMLLSILECNNEKRLDTTFYHNKKTKNKVTDVIGLKRPLSYYDNI